MSLPVMPRMLNRNPAAASARVPSPYTAMAVTLSSAPALSKSSTSGSSQSDVGGVFFATRVRASSSALLRCSRAVRLCASDSFKFVATMRSPLGSAGMGMASPGACVSRNFSNSSTRLVYSGVPGFPVSLKFPHRSPNHASSSQHLDAAPPPFVAFAFFKHADATVFASSCAVGPLSSVTDFLTAFSTSVTRLAGRSSLTLSKKRSASRCFTHPPFCFFLLFFNESSCLSRHTRSVVSGVTTRFRRRCHSPPGSVIPKTLIDFSDFQRDFTKRLTCFLKTDRVLFQRIFQ
mmetsp:Transcript_7370/g.19175  ORF Transcript_7370/g.19175 Transcript_7370/m.19175 type:complete len:290 (+) Transcript_7370:143-1012(+)